MALSYVFIKFLPYFGLVIANWRLKAIKFEASQNPIETMQNDLIDKQTNLAKYKELYGQFVAGIYGWRDRVATFKREHPDNTDRIKVYEAQLDKMEQLAVLRKNKYEQTQAGLVEYAKFIDEQKADWEMAQESAKMNKLVGADGDSFLKDVARSTAIDSVQKAVNSTFADLDIAFLDESKEPVKEIKNVTPPVAIEATPVKQLLGAKNTSLDLDLKSTIEADTIPVPRRSRNRNSDN
jgi:hypothetical protein